MRLVNPAAAAESADSAEQPPNSVASNAKLRTVSVNAAIFKRRKGDARGRMYAVRKKIQLKKSKMTWY